MLKKKSDLQATKGELSNFLLILQEHLEENGFFSVLERKNIGSKNSQHFY